MILVQIMVGRRHLNLLDWYSWSSLFCSWPLIILPLQKPCHLLPFFFLPFTRNWSVFSIEQIYLFRFNVRLSSRLPSDILFLLPFKQLIHRVVSLSTWGSLQIRKGVLWHLVCLCVLTLQMELFSLKIGWHWVSVNELFLISLIPIKKTSHGGSLISELLLDIWASILNQ